MKYSILYDSGLAIYQIGPFDSEDECLKAAKEHEGPGKEFSIYDTFVCMLTPEHRMVELHISDFYDDDSEEEKEE